MSGGGSPPALLSGTLCDGLAVATPEEGCGTRSNALRRFDVAEADRTASSPLQSSRKSNPGQFTVTPNTGRGSTSSWSNVAAAVVPISAFPRFWPFTGSERRVVAGVIAARRVLSDEDRGDALGGG